ncbi:MAG: hypothetical protein GXO74_08560 [Calditrichaeota bacterium]|nr:hypothetical protein [Calditrichota bacterium]
MKNLHTYLLLIFCIVSFRLNGVIAQSITVIHADGSVHAGLRTESFQNALFVALEDFADIFNAPVYYDSTRLVSSVHIAKKKIAIAPLNSFLMVDNRCYQLPVATKFFRGKMYVPLSYFFEIVNREFPGKIKYDPNKKTLSILKPIYSKKPNIRDIDIEQKLNGTLIAVVANKNFTEADISLRARHRWLYLDIYGGIVDSLQLYAEYQQGMVARIVPSQVSNELAQIGFRLRDKIVEKNFMLPSPRKIIITVKTKRDVSDEINRVIEQEKKKWLIDKIVIDPGHGGRDPGAIGAHGIYEKNVVLAIAKYLRDYLVNGLGVTVLMTRDSDRFVELKERPKFANRNQAKLFISIHANSNPQKSLRGVSTYFLGPDKSNEAREVAQFENSVIKYENKSNYSDMTNEQFILSAGAQSMYTKESEDLAGMVQETIMEQCGLQNRGVRQANFYVLWGASMPNVLIETAFISNSREEKLLRTPSFQKKLAYSIYVSVKKFKEKYESMF